jgi:lysyl-tRNA synthetase, class I
MANQKPMHWADSVALKVIAEKGDKKKYVCAAGITPSGTIHIGNFREIITVELVVRALRKLGKEVRFIYSWDDYDVFRKVPKNMPQQEMLAKNLRKPIIEIPDPFGTESSYARHHEVKVEEESKKVGIYPEYLYQSKRYRALAYVEGIKTALQNRKKIVKIMNQWRKEPLKDSWYPLRAFCPKCNRDEVDFFDYDGEYSLKIHCITCEEDIAVDIRKAPFLKLPWRVDWPMRWAYEQVDFEPGGKDHSTPGSSFTTGKEIVEIYNWTPPTYIQYDFIGIKGTGGKISSSKGNVIDLGDCLEVYEPEIVRYMFAGTRPNKEFSISFDLDLLKIYEDFDKLEKIYFGKEEVSEKKIEKFKRMYELSCVDLPPKKMPFQPGFRHLTTIVQIYSGDVDKTVDHFDLTSKEDKEKVRIRTTCAKNWLEKYAPEDFKFAVQETVSDKLNLSKEMKSVFIDIAKKLQAKKYESKELHEEIYQLVKSKSLEPKEFFKQAYLILVNKEKGPQLASFILTIGQKEVATLFEKV